ncbi:hypothetical protein GCM10008098_14830 [Rhodanobacter panaciterrae]|uniref:Uncharacterized protein n=1 Tax=Rhodanobacter panaciterrae TaxID=490572 RepID=A0ABQ2ZU09_9GAMM|nr:hypothetical protein GCM10008098_14830 [Rhodanobacter panaciterrae]
MPKRIGGTEAALLSAAAALPAHSSKPSISNPGAIRTKIHGSDPKRHQDLAMFNAPAPDSPLFHVYSRERGSEQAATNDV